MTTGRNKLIAQKQFVDKLIAQKQFVDKGLDKHSQGPLASLTCISYWLLVLASCWLAALTGFSHWLLLLALREQCGSYWLFLVASIIGFSDWLVSNHVMYLLYLYILLSCFLYVDCFTFCLSFLMVGW